MGFWSDMWGDNKKPYDNYEHQMQGLAGGYDPYIEDGKKMLGDMMGQSQWLTNSPWALEDEMQSHYQQSPGFKYSQDQIQNRMNNNAALTGMLGSGPENQSLQDALMGNLQQNMGQYVDRGMNTFNTGLNTESNINNMGFNALGDQNQLMQQGYQSGLEGQLSHNLATQKAIGAGIAGLQQMLSPGQSMGQSMGQSFGNLGHYLDFNSGNQNPSSNSQYATESADGQNAGQSGGMDLSSLMSNFSKYLPMIMAMF